MAMGEDYAFVFGSDAGKRVLRDLLRYCHVGVASHVPGDSHETAFRDGERNIALVIIAQLQGSAGGRETAAEVVLPEIRNQVIEGDPGDE